MTNAWVWIEPAVILAIHEEQLADHGGLAGTRAAGLLASALGRPAHLDAYGSPDVAGLAAAYAFGIARNHPFLDGNKRTAFVAAELFLVLNGHVLRAEDEHCVAKVLALAAGEIDEPSFAAWLRQHLHPR